MFYLFTDILLWAKPVPNTPKYEYRKSCEVRQLDTTRISNGKKCQETSVFFFTLFDFLFQNVRSPDFVPRSVSWSS